MSKSFDDAVSALAESFADALVAKTLDSFQSKMSKKGAATAGKRGPGRPAKGTVKAASDKPKRAYKKKNGSGHAELKNSICKFLEAKKANVTATGIGEKSAGIAEINGALKEDKVLVARLLKDLWSNGCIGKSGEKRNTVYEFLEYPAVEETVTLTEGDESTETPDTSIISDLAGSNGYAANASAELDGYGY